MTFSNPPKFHQMESYCGIVASKLGAACKLAFVSIAPCRTATRLVSTAKSSEMSPHKSQMGVRELQIKGQDAGRQLPMRQKLSTVLIILFLSDFQQSE